MREARSHTSNGPMPINLSNGWNTYTAIESIGAAARAITSMESHVPGRQ